MKDEAIVGIFCGVFILVIIITLCVFAGLNLYIPGQGKGLLDIIHGNEDSGYVLYKQRQSGIGPASGVNRNLIGSPAFDPTMSNNAYTR